MVLMVTQPARQAGDAGSCLVAVQFLEKHFTILLLFNIIYCLFTVQLITTVHDKLLVKYKGHYYTKTPYAKKNKWRCLSTNECYVVLVVNDDFSILKEPTAHKHAPKNFIQTENGKYMIVKAPSRITSDYDLYEIVQELPSDTESKN